MKENFAEEFAKVLNNLDQHLDELQALDEEKQRLKASKNCTKEEVLALKEKYDQLYQLVDITSKQVELLKEEMQQED